MKKILTILALVPLCCSAMPQDLKNSLVSGNPEVAIPHLMTGTPSAAPSDVISPKAMTNFHKTFKNVSDEKWYEMPDATRAKFTVNDAHYVVDYDKKGHWLHTICTSDEKKLPADMRQEVRTSYLDYSIICVKEITLPHNDKTYIVYLEGPSNFINLRIANGEMDEWQKYYK
jgi:hypothetical protein